MSDAGLHGGLVLGIDTSGNEGSLAIGRTGVDGALSLVEQVLLTGRHYADDVVPRLKELFAQAGSALGDVRAIVVVNGPGSFTGLRAGIGAAKALAEAGALPVVAVSRLALLASLPADGIHTDKVTVSVFDAGRSEYYVRLPDGEEAVMSREELAQTGLTIRVCEAKVKEELAGLGVEVVPPPAAFDALLFAVPRLLAADFDDVVTLDANYVRRPYANFAGPQ